MSTLPEPTKPTGEIPVVKIPYTSVTDTPDQSANRPEVKIGLVANMFVRMMHFKSAGDTEAGHTHSFDHLTLLSAGKLRLRANGQVTEYSAPTMIFIDAETQHELTALEDDTVISCIHGLRDLDVSDALISPDMVPNGVDMAKIMSRLRS